MMFASSVIRIISTERRTENLNDLQLINIVGDAWLSALVRSCEKSLPLAGSLQACVNFLGALVCPQILPSNTLYRSAEPHKTSLPSSPLYHALLWSNKHQSGMVLIMVVDESCQCLDRGCIHVVSSLFFWRKKVLTMMRLCSVQRERSSRPFSFIFPSLASPGPPARVGSLFRLKRWSLQESLVSFLRVLLMVVSSWWKNASFKATSACNVGVYVLMIVARLRRPFKVESHDDQYNDRPLSTLEYHAIKLLELVPNFFVCFNLMPVDCKKKCFYY